MCVRVCVCVCDAVCGKAEVRCVARRYSRELVVGVVRAMNREVCGISRWCVISVRGGPSVGH